MDRTSPSDDSQSRPGRLATPVRDDDWLTAAIDEVALAIEVAVRALNDAHEALAQARQDRVAGLPFLEIFDAFLARGGQARRVSASRMLENYETRMLRLRAAVVRELVDKEGMSLTGVSVRSGLSRQKVSRLYHLPTPDAPASDDNPPAP